MAELADALDLGSSVFDVQVQVLLSAPKRKDTPIDGASSQKGFRKITALVGSYRRLFSFAEKQGNQCNNHRAECKQHHKKLKQVRICYIHDIALPS